MSEHKNNDIHIDIKQQNANEGYARVPQTLTEVNGLVVRQRTQKGEAIAQAMGLPFESRNKYDVSLLPASKTVKNAPEDQDGWSPTAEELKELEKFLFVQEESDCFTRFLFTCIGWGPLRPLTLHFSVNGANGDVYVANRPFKLGGGCCCPLEMTLDEGNGRRIGRVRENFSPYLSKCCTALCCATTYTDIERALPDGSFEKKYALRVNRACCGRTNNCCAPSCCKNDAVYDILDTKDEVVAHLQHTYAPGRGCLGACCRMGFEYDNFILEFPKDSTAEDRILLLTGLFQVEFQLFEQKEQ